MQRFQKFLLLITVLVNITGVTAFAANDKVLPQFMFDNKSEPETLVAQKTHLAQQNDKLLLVVFGAEWCHDSKGLAAKFSNDQFLPQLEQKYEIAFVNVGYLDGGYELIQDFGQAIYYGTPTVLVVDPHTKQVLNVPDLKRWTSATAHTMVDYQDYFIQTDFKQKLSEIVDLKHYAQPIKQFEAEQAQRLRAAYKVLGPLLYQYKNDDDPNRSEFNYKWRQVWKFRTKVPDDVQALIKQAKANLAKGKTTPLKFPTYSKFSWES